jgi:hypothetical protein
MGSCSVQKGAYLSGEASADSTVELIILACCQVSGSTFRFFSVVDLTRRIKFHLATLEPAPVTQREERSISVPCCRAFTAPALFEKQQRHRARHGRALHTNRDGWRVVTRYLHRRRRRPSPGQLVSLRELENSACFPFRLGPGVLTETGGESKADRQSDNPAADNCD